MGYELKCPKCGERNSVKTVKGWTVTIYPTDGALEVRDDEVADTIFGICRECKYRAKLHRFVTTNV